MAKIVQRVSIIFIALLFFGFASALSIYVIVQAIQGNKGQDSSTAQTTPQQNQASNVGTKLDGFTTVSDVPSLKTTDTKPGDGAEITSPDQTVTVDYTGAVAATGIIFDSSQGKQPLTSQLTGLIQGWQQGMIGMKVGGERQMLIPAEQAYGANPPSGSGIPANAALVFNVTLKDVK